MNNKKLLIPLMLALVLVLGGAALLYDRLSPTVDTDQLATQTPSASSGTSSAEASGSGSEQEEIIAPDVIVYDIDGNPVHLADFFGKPIILNFWASWCGPCKSEMPDFQAKYEELGDRIHFLMVNATSGRETLDSASAFIADSGYTFPVYYDTSTTAMLTYGAYSLPTTLFIDAEGHPVAYANSAIDAATLQRGIDMILPPQS